MARLVGVTGHHPPVRPVDRERAPGGHERPPGQLTAVATIAALQGLALVVLAGVQVAMTISGHPARPWFAVFAAAMTLVAGLVLAGLGRALWRLAGAARTPLAVLELLALPVAWGLGQNRLWAYAVAVGGPSLVLLVLLATPAARAPFADR